MHPVPCPTLPDTQACPLQGLLSTFPVPSNTRILRGSNELALHNSRFTMKLQQTKFSGFHLGWGKHVGNTCANSGWSWGRCVYLRRAYSEENVSSLDSLLFSYLIKQHRERDEHKELLRAGHRPLRYGHSSDAGSLGMCFLVSCRGAACVGAGKGTGWIRRWPFLQWFSLAFAPFWTL